MALPGTIDVTQDPSVGLGIQKGKLPKSKFLDKVDIDAPVEGKFRIPDLEDPVPLPSEQQAGEEAFYTIANEDDPVSAIERFNRTKRELMETGESLTVNKALEDHRQASEGINDKEILNILGDPSITKEIKERILDDLLRGIKITPTLKQKYLDKTAATTKDNTIEGEERQDDIVETLQERRLRNNKEKTRFDAEQNSSKLTSFFVGVEHLFKSSGNTLGLVTDKEFKAIEKEFRAEIRKNPISTGLGTVGGTIGAALVAAPLGGLGAIAGMAFIGGVIQGTSRYAELGLTEADQTTRLLASTARGGATSADFVLPIWRAATIVKAMLLNGAGNVLIGELDVELQNDILEAFPDLQQESFDLNKVTVNAVMGLILGAMFGRTKKGIPEIDPKSPLGEVAINNPEMASEFGTVALIRQQDDLANALGVERGEIVGDFLLEKPFIDPALGTQTGISINQDLNALTSNLQKQFDDLRYDPNSLMATDRIQDIRNAWDVIKDESLPRYLPARSKNLYTDTKSQGSMVFGPHKGDSWKHPQTALKAREKLEEAIRARLPEDQWGTVEIKTTPDSRFFLQWRWEKNYDDALIKVLGDKTIQTSFLGLDVSREARSLKFGLGRWLFPIGRMPNVEQGAIRNIERAAKAEVAFLKAYDENITGTKFGKELNHLIREAEDLAKNDFTVVEMQGMFPNLKQADIRGLMRNWIFWRRIQDIAHQFANRDRLNRYIKADMQGVYAPDGTSLGYAALNLNDAELAQLAKGGELWDYASESTVAWDYDAFIKQGRKVVRMAHRVELPNGRYHRFGLIGNGVVMDMLPNQVLPKVPGYSPRVVKENFFVDSHPTEAWLDGEHITNQQRLHDGFSRSEAGVRTQLEGDRIVAQLRENHPDRVVFVRPAKEDNFGKVIDDMEMQGQILKESKRRGEERLPGGRDGEARIEDRLVTAKNSMRTIIRLQAFRQWEDSLKAAWVKAYGEFSGNEFPTKLIDIQPTRHMGREKQPLLDNARAVFEYYQNQKNFQTIGDEYWNKFFSTMAEDLEKIRIPFSDYPVSADIIRRIGGKGNLITKWPKAVASTLFIHTNPLRQWVIQPQQLAEMYFLFPTKAPKMFADMLSFRMAISSQSSIFKEAGMDKPLMRAARNSSTLSGKEFDEVLQAMLDSGMVEGIDKNVLVDGAFKDAEAHLVNSNARAMMQTIKKGTGLGLAEAGVKVSRKVGFDWAELTNRVGLWLQVRRLWQQKNLGKDWRTLEAKEEIAAEAFKLSGAMNRAGNIPYQQGALAVFLQFAAVTQKITMNLLTNATILTAGQRSRLAATRFLLYGGKAGLPAGALIYWLITQSDNPELQAAADMAEQGMIDITANWLANTLLDPDIPADIALARGITPYTENFLPMFDMASQLINMATDGPPTQDVRFASSVALSNIGKTVNEIQAWYNVEDIQDLERWKQVSMEVAEITSGMNNISQALIMLSMEDAVSKKGGNKHGWGVAKAEAFARAFGAQSNKTIRSYELIGLMIDNKKKINAVADEVHRLAMNVRNKIGTQEQETVFRQINSFISMIAGDNFTEQDILDVRERVMQLDRFSYVTFSESILGHMMRNSNNQTNENNQQMIRILKKFKGDPRVDTLLDWYEKRLPKGEQLQVEGNNGREKE